HAHLELEDAARILRVREPQVRRRLPDSREPLGHLAAERVSAEDGGAGRAALLEPYTGDVARQQRLEIGRGVAHPAGRGRGRGLGGRRGAAAPAAAPGGSEQEREREREQGERAKRGHRSSLPPALTWQREKKRRGDASSIRGLVPPQTIDGERETATAPDVRLAPIRATSNSQGLPTYDGPGAPVTQPPRAAAGRSKRL